jgi:hypothetical protein
MKEEAQANPYAAVKLLPFSFPISFVEKRRLHALQVCSLMS